MSDEQFHEFHLDGKQMVFLFMASTVMAVVIFLCGVMVGRGVRRTRLASRSRRSGSPTIRRRSWRAGRQIWPRRRRRMALKN
jgi:hypothetical protein